MIEASVIIYDTRQGGQATVPPGMSYSYNHVNGVYFHSDIVAGQNCSCLSYS